MDRAREKLIGHVLRVQSTIRTCEGCGVCCTDEHNTVAILPVEAERIARHLATLATPTREDFTRRMKDVIETYGLRTRGQKKKYTCPFLEEDLTCALPFEIKPVACLAFNPRTPESCEMDARNFDLAHAPAEAENKARNLPDRRVPIPVAILAAMERRIPKVAPASAARDADDRRDATIFLPRLLSKWHIASRTKAEALVREGRVTVNGAVRMDVLFRVHPLRDRVDLDGTRLAAPEGVAGNVWMAMNKPRGVVTTTSDPEGRETVMDLVGEAAAPGLAPVGRLDKDTGGLLLLSNDHDLADRVLAPASHVEKVYRVKVRGEVTEATLTRLRTETVESEGLSLGPIAALIATRGPQSTWLEVRLREGKNRQIRRQLAFFGHEVLVLVRTAFGPVELGDLPPGALRPLTSAEIAALRAASEPDREQHPVRQDKIARRGQEKHGLRHDLRTDE